VSWRRAPERLADLRHVPPLAIGIGWALALALGCALLGVWMMKPLADKQERRIDKIRQQLDRRGQ
jgi:uncharacterized membrane protein